MQNRPLPYNTVGARRTPNGYAGYQGYGSGANQAPQSVAEILSAGLPEQPDLAGLGQGAGSSRKIADLLTQRAMGRQPTGIADGLASLGEAWLARKAIKKADAADEKYQQTVQALTQKAMGGDEASIAMLLSPEAAIGRKDKMGRIAVEDQRYADERDYGRGRDAVVDSRYIDERDYGRGRDAIGDERYTDETTYQRRQDAAANAPRDVWLPMGDGNAINQRTGEIRGGSGAAGDAPPAMSDIAQEFDNPFTQLPVYGSDGAQVQGFTWRGGKGGQPIEDRRGLMEPNREGNARGDKKIDETVAKDIAAWRTGGRTTAFTNLQRLQQVITDLESGKNLSGPVTGNTPGWVQSFTNPDAISTRETVEAVIQGSLKAILGGQFTENEARAMMDRAYNPRLDEAANAKKLKTIYNDLVGRSATMEQMSGYQDRYGTVQGFESPTEGIMDFGKSAGGSTIPQNAIQALRANPMLRSQFDQKYGQGAAAQYLDGQGMN